MIAPVTREEIAGVLAARGLSPLHRYGQNFLVRADVLDRIVKVAGIGPGNVVLEVGPGTGGLTERLLAAGAELVAMEIDRGLAALVESLLGGEPRLTLVVGDILERKSAIASVAVSAVKAARTRTGASTWKVVANLPYQISSPFLAGLVQLEEPPALVVVTVQREVGDVILAAPGSAEYSPLSFLARLYFRSRSEGVLSPSFFFPRPKVESVVMHLESVTGRPLPATRLLPFARRLLQGRRKALSTTLAGALPLLAPEAATLPARDLLLSVGIEPNARIDAVEPARVEALAVEALKRAGKGT